MPELDLVGVVTAPDRPKGRKATITPTPVAARAEALGLPILKPERIRDPEVLGALTALRPDLGILADYGRIVPQAILDLPPLGILNVHPSLLPRHRGATPIPAAIAEGDPFAGVSVIRMDDGIDTGPIVSQESWMLAGTETAPELEATAATRGADLLRRTIPSWLAGDAALFDQHDAPATMTRPFRREDARLDPTRSAVELERQVRANVPWPGTFVETTLGRLGVIVAFVADAQPGDVAGTFVRQDGPAGMPLPLPDTLPALATSDGRLVLAVVQLAGRRSATGPDFLRGHPGIIGSAVTGR
jgi:methionyl-tRNA formyltransferase